METIWNNSPILRDICDRDSGPRRDVDRCVMRINESRITCLPLGDGQKIRGQRANDIISDEFASIPRDIFETVVKHPKLKLVLTEVHYKHYPWVMHLLKALPNLYIETSRFVVIDGIRILVDAIGSERILYGSRFPYSPFSPMLYSIHLSDLNPNQLNQICHTNLENLLKEGK